MKEGLVVLMEKRDKQTKKMGNFVKTATFRVPFSKPIV